MHAAQASREHWKRVYTEKDPTAVSWAEPVPQASLDMFKRLDLGEGAPIIDVGGGTSRLAAELVERGYSDVTVADISAEALERARGDFGAAASKVSWVVADVRDHDFGRQFAVWHDRAVFHFMVRDEDRHRYVEALRRNVAPDGHVVLATFGPQGPTKCSGLPVSRYGADDLVEALEGKFRLLTSLLIDHVTPAGSTQQFLYAHLRHVPS